MRGLGAHERLGPHRAGHKPVPEASQIAIALPGIPVEVQGLQVGEVHERRF